MLSEEENDWKVRKLLISVSLCFTFLHDALPQRLGHQDSDVGHRVRGEAEQARQEVLAELLHGHALLLHDGLQPEGEKTNDTKESRHAGWRKTGESSATGARNDGRSQSERTGSPCFYESPTLYQKLYLSL